MVVDPEASLSQLSDLTDITLVSVPSFWQDPELTQTDFCVFPPVGELISLLHWFERTQRRFWLFPSPVELLAHPAETNRQFTSWLLSLPGAKLIVSKFKFKQPLFPTERQFMFWTLLSPKAILMHPDVPTELQQFLDYFHCLQRYWHNSVLQPDYNAHFDHSHYPMHHCRTAPDLRSSRNQHSGYSRYRMRHYHNR